MTFRDELEKILIDFETYLMTTGVDGINRDQALTSIINLVDKELPEEINWTIGEQKQFSTKLADSYFYQAGYNQAIGDMRIKLKEK